MDFVSIRNYVCQKVSKNDPYSQGQCDGFVLARHKMIYEGYDWRAAQIIAEKTLTGAVTWQTIPEVHHSISVRLDGRLLDPVNSNYIFDNATGVRDDYTGSGTPLYYDEELDLTSGTRKIRLYPSLANDGQNHTLVVLGKAPYSNAWTSPAVPATEEALIAFVTGDMWEYLHEVGKAQAKFQEGAQLLTAAQQQDAPALRPRMSTNITATGNSLGELVYATCDVIGEFTPNMRSSVKDRIRRNYASVWDSALWPETLIMQQVTASGDTLILPHLFDKVISVRINLDAANSIYKSLQYADNSLFFAVQPGVFNQTGEPVSYSLLTPIGLPATLNEEGLQFVMTGSESATVFVKGELRGVTRYETLAVSNTPVSTVNTYDTILSITKPVTKNSLNINHTDGTNIVMLYPTEQERKYQRIRILPAFASTADQSMFILGKRGVAQLMDDGDTAQISGVENILINGAASDILGKSNAEFAVSLRQKADAHLKILIDREINQQTNSPQVIPYTENLYTTSRSPGVTSTFPI